MNMLNETTLTGTCGLIGCCYVLHLISNKLIKSSFTKLLTNTTIILIME